MFLRLFVSLIIVINFMSCNPNSTKIPLYIGTYTLDQESQGIYEFEFDTQTADVTLLSETKTSNPSFLAKTDQFLLAVNENNDGNQSLSSFSISQGKLNFINKVETDGGSPCHVLLDEKGRYAVVSNYSGGSLNLYSLSADGKILSKDDYKQYHGSSIDSNRQKSSHIHSAFFGPNHLVYVSDLGADQIYCLGVESLGGKLKFVEKDILKVPAGSGPRHLAFHPNGKTMYALMEMTGDVIVFNQADGKWEIQQTINMNQENFKGKSGAADIKVSADGKFVYATNRSDANTITCFATKPTGELSKIQVTSVLGKGPRSFNFSPDERFVLVANQLSDELVIFLRDERTGKLTDSKKRIKAFKPVSVLF